MGAEFDAKLAAVRQGQPPRPKILNKEPNLAVENQTAPPQPSPPLAPPSVPGLTAQLIKPAVKPTIGK